MTEVNEQAVRDMTEIAMLHAKLDKACGPHQVAIVVAVMCQMLGEAAAQQTHPKAALGKIMEGIMMSFQGEQEDARPGEGPHKQH